LLRAVTGYVSKSHPWDPTRARRGIEKPLTTSRGQLDPKLSNPAKTAAGAVVAN